MANERCLIFRKVVRVYGVIVSEFGNKFGAKESNVNRSWAQGGKMANLAATIARIHALSSMTPTSVASSTATVGTFMAPGKRAKQFDLF